MMAYLPTLLKEMFFFNKFKKKKTLEIELHDLFEKKKEQNYLYTVNLFLLHTR